MWAQATTVAYEGHIGRRVPGQRADGTFQCSVSKATALGMADLMAAWRTFAAADAAVRDLVGDEVRVSGTDRRITWRATTADGSSVIVTSEPKRDGTASLVAAQLGTATADDNDAARERWRDIVRRFAADLV